VIIGKPLREWQKQVVNDVKGPECLRKINVIMDSTGGSGKGFLRQYLQYHGLAQVIPVGHESKRMMEWVMEFPKDAYVIDIPRDTTNLRSHNSSLWRSLVF